MRVCICAKSVCVCEKERQMTKKMSNGCVCVKMKKEIQPKLLYSFFVWTVLSLQLQSETIFLISDLVFATAQENAAAVWDVAANFADGSGWTPANFKWWVCNSFFSTLVECGIECFLFSDTSRHKHHLILSRWIWNRHRMMFASTCITVCKKMHTAFK